MSKTNNNSSSSNRSSNSSSSTAKKLNGSYPEQVIEPEVIVLARRRQFSAKVTIQQRKGWPPNSAKLGERARFLKPFTPKIRVNPSHPRHPRSIPPVC